MNRLSQNLPFALEDVLLKDEYYINSTQKELEYLLSFDVDKLLAGFRETAGLEMKGAERYPGWENSLIGGHTLGHYMTACVQAYRLANSSLQQKEKLIDILSRLIYGLKDCQDAVGTGFIFGSTILDKNNIELQFDHVEMNKTDITTQAWVPWYTMHKIIAGLVIAAELKDEKTSKLAATALEIAAGIGNWTYDRISRWSQSTRKTVLDIEYGGMNDCLYDLYALTGVEKYRDAAHAFDQTELFERVRNSKSGDHVLNNIHANTTIPKFMGALNRYLTCGKDKTVEQVYLDYTKAFWELVVHHHTYMTGGNSEWEHFGKDDILDLERTNCNCETCNVHNMLKLTKKLFMLTGDVKYADYYENAFLNSILSSQNPDTGMTTYFQPMATGYFKVFSEPYSKFWCCTGTGMENFTKLQDGIYYNKENTLIINQYISSELNWVEKKVKLIQEAQIPEKDSIEFQLQTIGCNEVDITLGFRLPEWLAADAVITCNGVVCQYNKEDGYAYVYGPFTDGASFELKLPMEIRTHSLCDHKDVYGFQYGPVVLSARLGTKEMIQTTTGVNVTIPMDKLIEVGYTKHGNETITVNSESVVNFMKEINTYLIRKTDCDKITFNLRDTDADLTFVSHYSQFRERYGIYWYFTAK